MLTSGRSPQGERGLKLAAVDPYYQCSDGRSPQGERGLKPEAAALAAADDDVAPRKGSVG